MRCPWTGALVVSLTGVLGAQSGIVNRKLSGPMVNGQVGDVGVPVPSPSGDRLLYRVFRGTEVAGGSSGPAALVVVAADGSGAPITLAPPDVVFARWSPDGTQVVFLSERADGDNDLYVVPADGSGAPMLLVSPSASTSENIQAFQTTGESVQLTGDGSRVVYRLTRTEGEEVYSVPITGGTPVRLNGPLVQFGDVWSFLTSGSTVVYRSDQVVFLRYNLYSVPADGSAAPINLSQLPTDNNGVLEGYEIDPAGARVVYRTHQTPPTMLFSAPIDGSAAAVPLCPANLPSDREVGSFRVSPDGASVVYLADQSARDDFELFLAPIDGSAPAELLLDLAPDRSVNNGYEFSPDGAHVVCMADIGTATHDERLISVRVSDGSVVPLHTESATSFRIAPDSARVAFLGLRVSSRLRELYSVPIDGSSAAVRINPNFVTGGEVKVITSDRGYAISPDSLTVVYRADAETVGVNELYRVAALPGGPPVATQLNPALVTGGDVSEFLIAIDSSAVVYRVDDSTDDVTDLVRSALDGPPAPIVLNDPPVTAAVGDAHQIVARNGRVVYGADEETDGRIELFGVPSDGSSPAVRLGGTLVAGGNVVTGFPDATEFFLTPDGSTVVYRADAQVDERYELFSQPSDGSAPPTKLNGTLIANTDVDVFAVSPDGTRVVFRADQGLLRSVPIHGGTVEPVAQGGLEFEITPDSSHVLFEAQGMKSAPIVGSAGAADLSEGRASIVYAYEATPDGSRAAFTQSTASGARLFSNAIDGGSLVDLSGQVVGFIPEFAISSDGERVVYRADAFVEARYLLFSVPVDGGAAPLVLNGGLPAEGDVTSFLVLPGGEDVVYVADQESNGLHNLYRVPLDGSAPAVRLSAFNLFDAVLRTTLDGAHVMTSDIGLRSILVAGGEWVVLSPDADAYEITNNGLHVAFTDAGQLFVTPIEGGPVLPIAPEPVGAVQSFVLDGPRAVYLADQDELEVTEVYASLPGSGPGPHTPPSAKHAPPSATRSVER